MASATPASHCVVTLPIIVTPLAEHSTTSRRPTRRNVTAAVTRAKQETKHMALFSKNPEKTTTSERDAVRSNVERLAGRLADAEQAVITAKSAAQKAALSGDDVGLDAAEASEAAAQRRLASLRAAHAESGKVLATLEMKIAEASDKKTRTATAAATDALADELVEVSDAYVASTALFHTVMGRVKAVSVEGHALEVFTAASITEVSAAVPIIVEVLRQHARAVVQGFANAQMPIPAPVNAVPAPPAPSFVTLFSTQPFKWRDADGKQRSCGKGVDIELPTATANRALAAKVAVRLDHPSRKTDRGQWPSHVAIAHCYDLDADAAPPQHEATIHSAFERVDRGKPYALKIAVATS
jgi:hypothetical protein